MRKSEALLKSIISVALAMTFVFSMVSTAFAGQVVDEELILEYLYTFNSSVNSIKSDNPSFKYTKTAEINKKDDIIIGTGSSLDISADAEKYLKVLVDAFFNPEKGLVNNFIAVLTETETSYTEMKIAKGVDTTNLLPLRGKDYISDLTVGDEFTVYSEKKTDLLNPDNDSLKIRFTFPEYDLETVKDSALDKVFDLPSGAINPVVIGGVNFDKNKDPLDDVKFEDFLFHNAYVQADFNGKGELVKYIQNISYTFSLNFYDMLRIFTAFTNIDLMKIGLAIANPILSGLGQPEVTAKEILKNSTLYIRYDTCVELTSFDWSPRLFGDVDNNGTVNAYDARSALRSSVNIEKLEKDEDLIYSDVDFNGIINAADARKILRMSVNLEEKFDEVPEGESVKIVIVAPPVVKPEEPDDDDDTNDDFTDEEGNDGNPIVDGVAEGISEFIDSIFDTINAFKGDGVSNEGIAGLVNKIKEIIDSSK